ncbi:universal stress protein [Sungkyunkwania multivorans]|uniref:Universal stress protein n=1 Tax=Sungkyunkwania multivorans TaxID=1173618 RepID=A0ABW3D0G1_9FLAO
MKNILVPIGSSEARANTLQYAIDFANAFGSTLHVMQAYTLIPRAGAISNVNQVMQRTSKEDLEALISKADTKGVKVNIVTYKGDALDGIKDFEKEYGLDLIIIAPRSTDIREEVFLGNTTGSIVKQTDTPVLVIPDGTVFSPVKTILTAFKSGRIKKKSKLTFLKKLKAQFDAEIKLLLVKTPGYDEDDLKIAPAMMDLSSHVTISENATTYQGVLEHFQTIKPDMLCVFRRKRGFFKKLWEKNVILKKEFHTTIPLLILSGDL